MLNSSELVDDSSFAFQKTIPIEMKAHMMVVNVHIDDMAKPYKFLVDTGAISVLTERVAKDLQFLSQNDITMKDIAGNTQEAKLVTVNKMGIHGAEVRSLAAVVINLDKIDSEIDGILGSNYFQHFNLGINYQEASLSLSNKCPELSCQTIVIPFKKNIKYGFAPTAECIVDGVPLPCMIDTGAPDNVTFPLSKFSALPASKNKHYCQSNGSVALGLLGNGGNYDVVFDVERFEMGNLQLTNIAMLSHNSDDNLITIGKEFLDNYIVNIDYKNGKLYLTPLNISPKKAYPIYTFGFSFAQDDDGVTRVIGLWDMTSGARTGIEVGDEILSVNGIPAPQLQMLQLVSNLVNNTSIVVEFKKHSSDDIKTVTVQREDISEYLINSKNGET